MPVKLRIAKARRAVFSDEAVALFAELERARQNPRIDPKFQDKSRQLALMLGLIDEWACSVCHVNDGSSHSGYPPGHLTDLAFWRVLAVQQLLAVCAQRARDAGKGIGSIETLGGEQEPAESVEASGSPPAA